MTCDQGCCPKEVLDLFCGGGGAAMGLHRAWPHAHITGVDIVPQKHYPFTFILADAMTFPLVGYDFIWASPPCQRYSKMTRRWNPAVHPDLIEPMRSRLVASGAQWVMENVEGAPLLNPLLLCGTMFGLTTKHGSQLRRHRIFESPSILPFSPRACMHNGSAIGVYGGGQHPQRRRPATIGVYGHADGSSKRDGLIQFGTDDRRTAMGIDWMATHELSQAIPPAYSEHIARQVAVT
jgi:DNA (cytosine-5)-methyltransferase 1